MSTTQSKLPLSTVSNMVVGTSSESLSRPMNDLMDDVLRDLNPDFEKTETAIKNQYSSLLSIYGEVDFDEIADKNGILQLTLPALSSLNHQQIQQQEKHQIFLHPSFSIKYYKTKMEILQFRLTILEKAIVDKKIVLITAENAHIVTKSQFKSTFVESVANNRSNQPSRTLSIFDRAPILSQIHQLSEQYKLQSSFDMMASKQKDYQGQILSQTLKKRIQLLEKERQLINKQMDTQEKDFEIYRKKMQKQLNKQKEWIIQKDKQLRERKNLSFISQQTKKDIAKIAEQRQYNELSLQAIVKCFQTVGEGLKNKQGEEEKRLREMTIQQFKIVLKTVRVLQEKIFRRNLRIKGLQKRNQQLTALSNNQIQSTNYIPSGSVFLLSVYEQGKEKEKK